MTFFKVFLDTEPKKKGCSTYYVKVTNYIGESFILDFPEKICTYRNEWTLFSEEFDSSVGWLVVSRLPLLLALMF
jgi:hypothetical protein